MSGLSVGTRVSNLKSVGLTVLELLAFNAQKFRGHVTLATPPFGKIFGVMSGLSLGTRVSNLKSVSLTVLELLAFNSHRSAAHRHRQTDRQTDRQTHIERTHYLRHSLRSLGGDNNQICTASYAKLQRLQTQTVLCSVLLDRDVARNLLRGTKEGVWGTRKSPSGVQGQSPGEVWGEAPRSQRQMLISSYDGGHAPIFPLATPLLLD